MEPPKIKTYSKKEPIITFVPSATLAPSQPRVDDKGDIRPSCLNEKTLTVDYFEDTFDRLAYGVVVPSPKKLSDQLDTSSYNECESKDEKNDLNFIVDDSIKNKNLKRKTCDSDEDSDSNFLSSNQNKIKIIRIEEPKEDYKRLIQSKRKNIFNNIKPTENFKESNDSLDDSQCNPNNLVPIEDNKNQNSIVMDDSTSILKELQPSKNNLSFLLPLSNNLPTSTPRGDKLRTLIDVKNISPISFNKENLEVSTLKNKNEKAEFLKPQAIPRKSKVQNITEIPIDSENLKVNYNEALEEETANIQNLTKLKINVVKNKEYTLEDEITDASNDQRENSSPVIKNSKHKSNFVESPIIFNDTEDFKNQNNENLNNSDQIAKNLFKTSFQNLENEKVNDSSYYPHEWSNEYDTSYEAFNDKEDKSTEKSLFDSESSKADNMSLVEKQNMKKENFEKSIEKHGLLEKNSEECKKLSKTSNEISFDSDNSNQKNKTAELSKNNEILKIIKKVDDVTEEMIDTNFDKEKIKTICIGDKENDNERNIHFAYGMTKESEDKMDTVEQNKGLILDKKLSKLPVVYISESDNKYISDYLLTASENKSKFVKINSTKKINLNSGKDSDNVINVNDDFKTIENKNDLLQKDERKNNLLKSMMKTVTSNEELNTEKIITKVSDKNLQLLIKKLNVDYSTKGSPILSRKSSTKKTNTGRKKGKKKGIEKVENNFEKLYENTVCQNNLNIYKTIKDYNKSSFNNDLQSISSKSSEKVISKNLKHVQVFITKEDIENVDNYLQKKKVDQDQLSYQSENNVENKDLFKFKDLAKVTMRKNVFKKWDRPLAAISEADQTTSSISLENKINSKMNKNNKYSLEEVKSSDSTHISKPIFLKPGKSWARSLSIINHFQNNQNLDELAVGRGQNWRKSVQTILNMQSDDNSESSSKKGVNELSNDITQPNSLKNKSKRFPSISSRCSSYSPNRLSNLRFSMRIVPSPKRSTLSDDLIQRISSVQNTRKTSTTRKTSLKNRRDTLIQTEDDLIKSAKDIVLKHCNQTSYLSFSDCFPETYTKHCRKIGEGVYGEVYMYDNKTEKSVIKIIPIEGKKLVNCEPQKKFHEILSEIIIAEELHKLRFGNEFSTDGFVGVNRIMCVIGKYPEKLIKLWKTYDKEKTSENDCPSMFDDNQLFIILELAHGGQDLEAYQFQNASESFSIFIQTALALAVAEKILEFEHRDLHWGNILISKTDAKNLSYIIENNQITLKTRGVKVSVIDFTLSRMSYKGCRIFNDLAADPSLFTAQGEYQFDIYRMMRDYINNDWQQFNPYTNVLWLDYTLDKMISAVKYKKKTTKIHKNSIDQMKQVRKELLNYKSAFDLVHNCNIFKDFYN